MPISVAVLPVSGAYSTGRLGFTQAPRDMHADLAILRNSYECAVLFSLLEDDEFRRLHIEGLPTAASALGIDYRRFPIKDFSVPSSIAGTRIIVDSILAAVRDGKSVVIHCWGGLGRSGLMAACCLTQMGHAPAEAMKIIRAVRPGAVETPEQEAFVTSFAAEEGPGA